MLAFIIFHIYRICHAVVLACPVFQSVKVNLFHINVLNKEWKTKTYSQAESYSINALDLYLRRAWFEFSLVIGNTDQFFVGFFSLSGKFWDVA